MHAAADAADVERGAVTRLTTTTPPTTTTTTQAYLDEAGALAEAYLRDGGWLDVLERGPDGLEKWTRCYGVINVAAQVFEVSEAPLPDAERLLSGAVRDVRYTAGAKTFEVAFAPQNQVAEFRCKHAVAALSHADGKADHDDVVAAASWAMSLRALIDDSDLHPSQLLPPLRQPAVPGAPPSEYLVPHSGSTMAEGEDLGPTTARPEDRQGPSSLSTDVDARAYVRAWPPRPATLPWCGYMLVLSAPVSQKWRETFVVLGPDAIAELSAPARGAVLFMWKADPEAAAEVRLARPRSDGPLEVHLVGCEPSYLSTDDPTPAAEDIYLRMVSQTDEMTFAWAYAVRSWLTEQDTSPRIPKPIRWTSASSIARHCAMHVLAHGSTVDDAGQRAASALACTIDGPHLVKAAREPYRFRLRCLLPDRVPGDAVSILRGLTARVERVGGPRARLSIEFLGLDLAEAAAIVHDKAMDFHVKPFFRQTAQYRLHVHYRGFPVYGSPLRVKAEPGPPSPSHCTIEDLRIRPAPEKKLFIVQFTVARRDALLNHLANPKASFEAAFGVELASGSPGRVVDIRGAQLAQCTVHLAVPADQVGGEGAVPHGATTEIEVEIKLGDQAIRDSPLRVRLPPREEPASMTGEPDDISVYRALLGRAWSPAVASSTARTSVGAQPRTGATPIIGDIKGVREAYIQLDKTLEPLAQVARIERRDAAPSAQWKRLLSHQPCLPTLTATTVPEVLSHLRALSIAFSKSMLPSRHVLVQQIDALVQVLAAF